MPERKRAETLDFVKGLLASADLIRENLGEEFHPRDHLNKKYNPANYPPDERRRFGMYQGRVVLVALAAELALKFAWEGEHPSCVAPSDTHNLDKLFQSLKPARRKRISNQYLTLADPPKVGWETAQEVFKKCKDAYKRWEYIVEEDSFPNYIMQAAYLIHATRAVIDTQQGDDPGTTG